MITTSAASTCVAEAAASPFIIAGMHRSGTSLAASLFQNAGLFIGDSLLGSTPSNKPGHFENIDFVTLHENMLESQGLSPEGWVAKMPIAAPETFRQQALNLLNMTGKPTAWGWKDPRTTLFLDFWLELVPNARFIFLIRSPWQVTDSLFRREDKVFQLNPQFAVDVWQTYNESILTFYHRHESQCIITSAEHMIAHGNSFINQLNSRFSSRFDAWEQNIYQHDLLNRNVPLIWKDSFCRCYPESVKLWRTLQEAASLEVEQEIGLSPESRAVVVADWMKVRRNEVAARNSETLAAEQTDNMRVLEASFSIMAEAKETLHCEVAANKESIKHLEDVARAKERVIEDLQNQIQSYGEEIVGLNLDLQAALCDLGSAYAKDELRSQKNMLKPKQLARTWTRWYDMASWLGKLKSAITKALQQPHP